jgi:hypothetical protein
VQLLLLGVALVAASFYAGTLFGPSASPELVLPPSRPQSPDSSRSKGAYLHLPSSVWLRSDPLVDRISSPLRGFLEKKKRLMATVVRGSLLVVVICAAYLGLSLQVLCYMLLHCLIAI